MKKKTDSAGYWVIVAAIIGFVVGISYLMARWTDRNLDFWLTYFKGETVDVPLWLSWLAAIALNVITFAANVISEIARFFI